MQDMRYIAENIVAIRIRRSELASVKPVDRDLAEELSDLEAKASLFAENCTRHHRVNLCQAGFVYGDVLRHPAGPGVAVAVRLADCVEIIEGPDTGRGEITILQATALLARTAEGSPSFRDWHADGRSIGQREDDLFMHGPRGEALRRSIARIGVTTRKDEEDAAAVPPPEDPRPAITPSPPSTIAAPAGMTTGPAVRRTTSGTRRPASASVDERMPDLFG